MKIERRSLLAGAADAHGIVIVIDVLRAFSCSALMFHYGIRDLALVRTPEEALAFRDRDPDYLVAGEVKGVKVEGFDVGNSPADIVSKGESFFRGRRVAARSSAGTQGVLAAAAHAEQVLLGSYMTAASTAAYIRDHAHVDALVRGHETTVTIVAMGFEGVRPSVEDERVSRPAPAPRLRPSPGHLGLPARSRDCREPARRASLPAEGRHRPRAATQSVQFCHGLRAGKRPRPGHARQRVSRSSATRSRSRRVAPIHR